VLIAPVHSLSRFLTLHREKSHTKKRKIAEENMQMIKRYLTSYCILISLV